MLKSVDGNRNEEIIKCLKFLLILKTFFQTKFFILFLAWYFEKNVTDVYVNFIVVNWTLKGLRIGKERYECDGLHW